MKSFGNIRKQALAQGFTMVEVVVAAVIFALVTSGVFVTITSLSQPSQESTEEITAAFLAKGILEDLRNEVDARTWGNAVASRLHPLGGPGGNGVYTDNINIGNTPYAVTYTVTNDVDVPNVRKVVVTIDW